MKKQSKKFSMLCVGLLAASALFVGCGNEDVAPASVENGNNDGRVALRVNSGIQTRAAGKTWSQDDAIGIYMVNTGTQTVAESASNRLYKAQAPGESSAFEAEGAGNIIYYPVDGSSVDFLLYYPQRSLTDNVYSIDVTNQNNLPAIDLMTAKVTGKDKTQPVIEPKFFHLLAKLKLNIKNGEGITVADLNGLKVDITNQRTKGSYNVLKEEMTLAQGQNGEEITLNTVADGTQSEAILLPTTEVDGINPIIDGRQLTFTLNATGETFKWDVPNEKQFEAGKENVYNITINRTPIGVTATIEDWTPGNAGGEDGSAE